MHRARYFVGLLTLAATVLGAVVLLGLLDSGGDRPGLQLRLEFRDARGLRAGADVRYRGVTVGAVRSVVVSDDGGKAVVDLLLEPAGAAQACINSSFWIVSPRFAGLAGGATGLDTLVRDAYVAFLTPDPRGTPLHGGSLLGGSERPPGSLDPDAMEPVAHGDLLMSVLVPENHNLRPGSPVVFRGITTGDVRSVELADNGDHVEVRLRIARRYRQTVTDQSTFWVARPYVSGALFSGFTVSDVDSLLSPFVNYYTKPGLGVPVEDGFRVAASGARPELKVAEVPAAALAAPARGEHDPADPLVLVHIVYAAIEEDSLSANDTVRHEGTGVLFLDRDGRAAVLTARSVADGSYTESDTFGGDPEIAGEQIKVLMPGGPVLRAHRVWVAADGRDLAVLVLEGAPPDLRVTPAAALDFGGLEPGAATQLRATGADGSGLPATDLQGSAALPELGPNRGGAVLVGPRVAGLLGQSTAHSAVAALVALDAVPDDLRPATDGR